MKVKRYGWVRDEKDERDYLYRARLNKNDIPSRIDLRGLCPPVYEQGKLGSCSANAVAAALEYDLIRKRIKPFVPSRLFIYYNERLIWKTTQYDSGSPLRLASKALKKYGVCDEILWPYDIRRYKERPERRCYDQAKNYEGTKYERIGRSLQLMKDCLASGLPFVFGFTAFESFESDEMAKYGILSMPKRGEKKVGQHAALAVGYDDAESVLIARNSWGEKWGDEGYFYVPYQYVLTENLAADFWAISFA
ncbi:MAG: C1 family peptidase [Conexivisphaerales archaeon]